MRGVKARYMATSNLARRDTSTKGGLCTYSAKATQPFGSAADAYWRKHVYRRSSKEKGNLIGVDLKRGGTAGARKAKEIEVRQVYRNHKRSRLLYEDRRVT